MKTMYIYIYVNKRERVNVCGKIYCNGYSNKSSEQGSIDTLKFHTLSIYVLHKSSSLDLQAFVNSCVIIHVAFRF
jgi:hypothetical protein